MQGSSTRLELAATLGARLVARGAGEAFSSPGAALEPRHPPLLARTRESEAAEPQRGSPRDERFSQFSLLAHVAAPLLASLRELAALAGLTQPVSDARFPSLLQTRLRCSDQACPEEQLFASQPASTPAPAATSEAPRLTGAASPHRRRRVLTTNPVCCPGLLIRRPIVGRISEARVPSCLGQQRVPNYRAYYCNTTTPRSVASARRCYEHWGLIKRRAST